MTSPVLDTQSWSWSLAMESRPRNERQYYEQLTYQLDQTSCMHECCIIVGIVSLTIFAVTAHLINLFLVGDQLLKATIFGIYLVLILIFQVIGAYGLFSHWLKRPIMERYSSYGRLISATVISRHQEHVKKESKYEVLVEYKPDLLNSSVVHAKTMVVERERSS